MEESKSRTQDIDKEGGEPSSERQRDGGPDEEQAGRGVEIPLVWQRLAVPFIPLVAEPPIDVDVNELSSGRLCHSDG